MEPKSNKSLLVFLLCCISFFNSAPAICEAHSQSEPDSPPEPKHPTVKLSLPTIGLNVGVGGVGLKIVSDPRIKSVCDKTDQPGLCLSVISPVFNGKTDIPSVVGMLIKAATDQTKQAIATAKKKATDPKSNAKTKSRLKDCEEIYDDALDNFKEAIEALPVHDMGTVDTMLSAAISDYGTCDDGFTGQPNPIPDGVSPMAKINENLMNIVGVILGVTKLIP